MHQIKYIFNTILSIPLFPILYYQGKRIRKTIPQLPEAKVPQGKTGKGQAELRLLSLGESTIAGVGVQKHEQGFSGHLANSLSQALNCMVHWQVIARSGYTAQKVHEKLISKIDAPSLDIIIIGLGGNDTFKMTPPNKWKKDLKVLIQKLQEKYSKTPIVFSNVPPIRDFPAFTNTMRLILGKQVDLMHEVLKELSQNVENVWYAEDRIELQFWLEHFKNEKYSAKDFFSDGVHPSELTYKTWAEEMAKFILENKIIKPAILSQN